MSNRCEAKCRVKIYLRSVNKMSNRCEAKCRVKIYLRNVNKMSNRCEGKCRVKIIKGRRLKRNVTEKSLSEHNKIKMAERNKYKT